MPLFHFCSHHFARLQQAHSHPSSSHSALYTLLRGGGLFSVLRGTVQLQGRQRLLRDCPRRWSKQGGPTYSATMGSRAVPHRGLQELMQPSACLHRSRGIALGGGSGEAAGNVGTHTVFTIGKHTLGQNRHAQYHILLSYRAASVSWSCSTPLSLVVEAAARLVEPGSYSYGNGSSFPSGSQGKRGPLVPIASLQLL